MAKKHTSEAKKSNVKRIVAISVAGGLLLLAAVVMVWLSLYQNGRFINIFGETNADTVQSVAYASDETHEFQKIVDLTNTTDENGIMDEASLKELGRLSSQIADRMVALCEDYDKNFVLSSEVPSGTFETFLLSSGQKNDLSRLASSLKLQEDTYCVESKNIAGFALLSYDLSQARADWYNTYTSQYADTQSMNRLKKYSDGSYKVAYRTEMIEASSEKLGEQLDGFIDMYAKAYDYAIETNEAQLGAKWDALIAADDRYNANPIYTGLEEALQQRAKESLKNTTAFYTLLRDTSAVSPELFRYSSAATTGTLLQSAINMYQADLDEMPTARSATELVQILKEKRYLDNGLAVNLEGVDYSSEDGTTATLTLTIESTGKAYEILL